MVNPIRLYGTGRNFAVLRVGYGAGYYITLATGRGAEEPSYTPATNTSRSQTAVSASAVMFTRSASDTVRAALSASIVSTTPVARSPLYMKD